MFVLSKTKKCATKLRVVSDLRLNLDCFLQYQRTQQMLSQGNQQMPAIGKVNMVPRIEGQHSKREVLPKSRANVNKLISFFLIALVVIVSGSYSQ